MAPPESPGLPIAGWYADPGDPGRYRYWDGARWTERTVAAAADPPPPARPDVSPNAPTERIGPFTAPARRNEQPTRTQPFGVPADPAEPSADPRETRYDSPAGSFADDRGDGYPGPDAGDPERGYLAPALPWWRRPVVLVGAGVVVGLFLIGTIAGVIRAVSTTGDTAAPAPAVTVTGRPGSAPSLTAPSVPAVPPSPSRQTGSPASILPSGAPSSASATTAPSASATASWVMPDEVGKVLQDAQDALQQLTGDRMFYSRSTDATGQNRVQVVDRNWKVCSQTPAAGATLTAGTAVVFAVVKLEETCP